MSTQARSIGRVLTRVRRHLPELRERYQVKSLGVFGSYVRGTQNRRSDIDVLVEFHQAPTLFEFVRLQTQLSRITGAKVDLVMKSALKPAIGRRVLEEVLYL